MTETKGDSGSTAQTNLSALRVKGLAAGLLTRSCLIRKKNKNVTMTKIGSINKIIIIIIINVKIKKKDIMNVFFNQTLETKTLMPASFESHPNSPKFFTL